MSEYYAASITLSQGAYDVSVTASLIQTHGQDETLMSITWPALPPAPDAEHVGEWLLWVLEDIVTNFHAHEVTQAERRPRKPLEGFTHS